MNLIERAEPNTLAKKIPPGGVIDFLLCAAVHVVHKHRRPRCVMSEICFELNYSDEPFPLSSEPLGHVNIKISPTLPR